MPARARIFSSRWLLASLLLILSIAGRASDQPKSYRLGLRFETNAGQYPEEVKFVARQPKSEILLTASETVVVLPEKKPAIRIQLLDASPQTTVEGDGRLSGTTNYFYGNDPKRWRSGGAVYQKVRYHDIYPGIDLLYYSNSEGYLEHDFVVAPGARFDRVRLRISGADEVALGDEGDLVLRSGETELRLKHPVSFQVEGDKTRNIASRFVLHSDGEVTLSVDEYDRSLPLIVDPQLQLYYNNPTFGGTSVDIGNGVAIDAQGNSYIVGSTYSSDIQFMGTAQATWNGGTHCGPFGSYSVCSDAFVVKIDSTGNVVYFTYLGGSLNDVGTAIAIDGSGNVYLTGSTQSPDFPLKNAAQNTWGGGTNCGAAGETRNCTDAFIAALDPNGGLIYSSFLGGSDNDAGMAIAVTPAGTAWVTGSAASTDLVPSQAAFATACAIQNNQCADGFIAKLSNTGSLDYLSYLRGNGAAVALDANGLAYVTGTASSNFLVRSNAFQGTSGGTTDGFLATIDATQAASSSLRYASYLGLNGGAGTGITVDATPNVYVTTVTGLIAQVMKFDLTQSGPAQRLYNTTLASPAHVTARSPRLDPTGVLWFVGSGQQQTIPGLPPTISQYLASVNSSGVFAGDVTNVTSPMNYAGLTVDTAGAITVAGTTYQFTPGQNNPGDMLMQKYVGTQPQDWLINPNPVVFAKQAIGSLLQANVFALNNTGAADMISNVALSSGFKMDAQNCTGLSTPNGSKCTFLIEFTGRSSGVTTGYLTFVTGASQKTRKVLLYVDAGTNMSGTTPLVAFSPATVDFGAVPLGSSVMRNTTLINNGDGIYPLGTINSSNVTESHDCGTSVPAKGTCRFVLTYTPHSNTDVAANVAVKPYPNGSAYSFVPPVTLNVSGGAVSPAGITLLPATLNFTQAQGGTSAPQSVTLTNATAAVIDNVQFATTGNFGIDSGSTTCGATLPANSSCTVGVIFSPPAAGTLFGTLTETDSANDITVIRGVGLVGNGQGTPSLSVSPTSLSLGASLVGVTALPKTITLSNLTAATGYLAVSSISTDGPFAQANNCVVPLAPNASCTITVTYTPTGIGSQSGHVNIFSNTTKKVINLSGTGNAPVPVLGSLVPATRFNGSPDLTITAKGSSFSTNSVVVWTPTGGTATNLTTSFVSATTLTATVPAALLATAGTAQVKITTPAPGGGSSAAKAFTITTNNPPTGVLESAVYLPTQSTSVPQGNSLTVSGWAADPDEGAPIAQVQVHVDPVSGAGNAVQNGLLGGSRGDVVTNTGRRDYYRSGWTAVVSTAALSPGTYTVTATASDMAGVTSVLPGSFTVTVTPTANGPSLGIAASLAFGNAFVGGTVQQILTVANVGTGTLTLNGVSAAGPFQVTSSCGAGIASGGSCSLLITFSPRTAGAANGSLTINSNSSAGTAVVNLTGTGIATAVRGGRPVRPSRTLSSATKVNASSRVLLRSKKIPLAIR